jgi:hypothetical protein
LGIYNGVDAASGAFPFAVMIKNERTDGIVYRCAGVLFAYNLVITESKLNIDSFLQNVKRCVILCSGHFKDDCLNECDKVFFRTVHSCGLSGKCS